MNIKDVLITITRLFGAYHIYLIAHRVLRFISIVASNSKPEYMTTIDVAIVNFTQVIFSLVIVYVTFTWSDKFSNWVIKPIENKSLSLSRQNSAFLIIVLSGLYTILFAFPDFVSDLALYIDYSRMPNDGIEIITAQTRGFEMSSNQNPIFAVIYDAAQLVSGALIMIKANRITAYITTGMKLT